MAGARFPHMATSSGMGGALSSVGRASRLHREGRRFEPVSAHHPSLVTRIAVAEGIATIRDRSGDLADRALAWRSEVVHGSLFGPRLLTSGAKIEGIAPVWRGTVEVGSEADIDAVLTRPKQRGKVDFVKITDNMLKPAPFLYAQRRSKALGIRTSGHIPMALTVDQAVAAGIGSDRDDHSRDAGGAYIAPRLRKTYDWRTDRAAKAVVPMVAGPTRAALEALPIRASGCTTRSSCSRARDGPLRRRPPLRRGRDLRGSAGSVAMVRSSRESRPKLCC